MAASECGIFLPFLANSKKQGQNKKACNTLLRLFFFHLNFGVHLLFFTYKGVVQMESNSPIAYGG